MEINRNLLRTLRVDIEKAIANVGQKHGVSVTLGNARFSSAQATFKLEVRPLGKGGVVVDPKVSDFIKYAVRFGLEPTMIGQKIKFHGKEYRIAGLRPKARINAVIVANGNDREFVMSPVLVRESLMAE